MARGEINPYRAERMKAIKERFGVGNAEPKPAARRWTKETDESRAALRADMEARLHRRFPSILTGNGEKR